MRFVDLFTILGIIIFSAIIIWVTMITGYFHGVVKVVEIIGIVLASISIILIMLRRD